MLMEQKLHNILSSFRRIPCSESRVRLALLANYYSQMYSCINARIMCGGY